MSDVLSWFLDNLTAAWAIAAVALLLAETIGAAGFLIPFASSALVVVAVLLMSPDSIGLVWQFTIFALLGLALIVPYKKIFRRHADKRSTDINQY